MRVRHSHDEVYVVQELGFAHSWSAVELEGFKEDASDVTLLCDDHVFHVRLSEIVNLTGADFPFLQGRLTSLEDMCRLVKVTPHL